MSIVAVHGPSTWGSGVGGEPVTNPGGTVTPDLSNGMRFDFAGAGDHLTNDYDWTFTGGAGAPAQNNIKSGTVTFTDPGAKVIRLNLGSTGGTTPPSGLYNFNVTAVVGPR